MKFCNECGDVKHVCDARLRHESCAEHPMPSDRGVTRAARRAAERMIFEGKRLVADGTSSLEAVVEAEQLAAEYGHQLVEQDRKEWDSWLPK